MQNLLLPIAVCIAVISAGCLGTSGGENDDVDHPEELPSGSDALQPGASFGNITFEDTGEFGAAVTQPDCSGGSGVSEVHQWQIPATHESDAPWQAETVTVTVTKDDTTLDLDLILIKDGEEIASNRETGPDSSENVTVVANDVAPGQLTIRVQACTSAFGSTYTVRGVADMVAA